MKVLSIAILKVANDDSEPIMMSQETELSSFGYFQRSTVKQMLIFISRTLIKRTPKTERQSVAHEDYMCHCYLRSDGLGAVMVTDKEYPARVAFGLETRLLDEFDSKFVGRWKNSKVDNEFVMPGLDKTIQEYQDPAKCDKVTQINTQIEETKNVLNKTIENVLERGVILDDLVAKSDDLSARIYLPHGLSHSLESKLFYKEAKKTNSCCEIF